MMKRKSPIKLGIPAFFAFTLADCFLLSGQFLRDQVRRFCMRQADNRTAARSQRARLSLGCLFDLLLCPQNGGEFFRGDDLYIFIGFDVEQVFVAGNQVIRFGFNGCR